MAYKCPVSKTTISMLEALKKRYTTESNEEQKNNNCQIILAKPRHIYHSDSLHIPCSVNLDSLGIASAGDFAEMAELCSHINELSLSSNQLTSLQEIIRIMAATPRLEFLNLKSNPLHNDLAFPDHFEELNSILEKKQEESNSLQTKQEPILPPFTNSCCFPNLNFLVLNDTQISWQVLHQILLICPKIQELHLSLIGFKTVNFPAEFSYAELLRLHFNNNQITDWTELLQLGHHFPKLDKLVMLDTAFTSLPDEHQSVVAFPELSTLSISNNYLTEWKEIDKLRYFPKLRQVRLNGSKLFMVSVTFNRLTELSVNCFPYYYVSDFPLFLRLEYIEFYFNNLTLLLFNLSVLLTVREIITKKFLTTSYFGDMATAGVNCLIKPFNGDGDVVAWLKKVDLVTRLQKLEDVATVIPLSISNNYLTEWKEIDKLRYFPKLRQVRLNGSKLFMDYVPKECTSLLIARLPNIDILNGREVTDKEREDAERFFLRFYREVENKPARYNELRLLHGDLKPLLDLNLCDDGLKVVIVFLEKSQPMTLDGKQTIKELKGFLKDFVGLPPSKFRLLHFTKSPEPTLLAIMDGTNRSLHSFRIQEYDEIHVQMK